MRGDAAPAGSGSSPSDGLLLDPFASLSIAQTPTPARSAPPPPPSMAGQSNGAGNLQQFRPAEVLLPSQLAAGASGRPPLSPSMQPLVMQPMRAPPPTPTPSPARPPPAPPPQTPTSNAIPRPAEPPSTPGVPTRGNLMRLVTPQVIELFREADEDGDGKIGASDAKGFFKRTGLPHLTLARVWELSDITQSGELAVECFALALRCASVSVPLLASRSNLAPTGPSPRRASPRFRP